MVHALTELAFDLDHLDFKEHLGLLVGWSILTPPDDGPMPTTVKMRCCLTFQVPAALRLCRSAQGARPHIPAGHVHSSYRCVQKFHFTIAVGLVRL
jgi:hypothetical protein